MSTEEIPTIDPQKLFLSRLVMMCDRVANLIFFGASNQFDVLDGLEGIISFLDEKSQKMLKTELDEINQFQQREKEVSATGTELKRLFNRIMAYLHKTYFQQIIYVKPRHGVSKLGMPK
jgi:hypothetical protein